jgi:hypothetical protein
MSRVITGGPAFPIECNIVNGFRDDTGVNLRDWFAAKAISGIIAAHTQIDYGYEVGLVVKEAYQIADAMMAESIRADEANAEARKEEFGDDLPF